MGVYDQNGTLLGAGMAFLDATAAGSGPELIRVLARPYGEIAQRGSGPRHRQRGSVRVRVRPHVSDDRGNCTGSDMKELHRLDVR